MKILYFDLVGGIAGDMTVAALLDLGVPWKRVSEGLDALGLEGLSIATERGERHSIAGTRFLVSYPGQEKAQPAEAGAPGQEHPHSHDQEHGEEHGHDQTRTHDHERREGQGLEAAHRAAHRAARKAAHRAGHGKSAGHENEHGEGHGHRSYRDVRTLIEGSRLGDGPKGLALAIFAKLAEAEGRVHGVPAGEVTFHEVGAWDSIADVVCTAVALDHLAPDAILCSAVPVGAGTVRTAHGRMPVPAPATLLLLEGFPIVQGGPAYERTTPTGAAILAALAKPAPEPFAYVPERVGVGIGTYDGPEVPNLLRAIMGSADFPGAAADTPPGTGTGGGREWIECAEANLDDANPEWIGYLMERLFAEGALDVALLPIQMKKNRPGTQIQVLYPPGLRETVQGLLFAEATTLGVRFHTLERTVLEREEVTVATPWGEVAGKVSHWAGRARFAPEFDSCRALALEAGVPLRELYRAAQQAYEATREGEE